MGSSSESAECDGEDEPGPGGITREPADGGGVPTEGGTTGASRFVETAVSELPAVPVVLASSDGPDW